MRIRPKSLDQQHRPQTTQHASHQNLIGNYKYLTLCHNEHQHLTPYLPGMARILNKIGTSKKTSMFEPEKAEQKQYQVKRYSELKQQYTKHRAKSKFDFEVDEIVLDCYDHTMEQGRRSIWKKYRSKVDDLSFEVLRMRLTRRGSSVT